jgi:excisionase family DNA binding protein
MPRPPSKGEADDASIVSNQHRTARLRLPRPKRLAADSAIGGCGGPSWAVRTNQQTVTRHRHSPAPLLDVAGVAERLGVTEQFIRRLVFERRIPFLKLGHFVRFEPDAVERWIADARISEQPRP